MTRPFLGTAAIEPADPVVAGSCGTWRLTFTTGDQPLPAGARLRVYTECDTDWGLPQLMDPSAPDYLTVQSPPHAPVAVRVDTVKSLTLIIGGRGLSPGDELAVTYGDRSGGGPGSRAQCFAERHRYFHVDVAPDPDQPSVTLPESPSLEIVGGDAVKLVVIVPSTITAGDAIQLLVRAEDAWGNPAQAYRGTVTLTADTIALESAQHSFTAEDGGLWWVRGRAEPRPGTHTITARDQADSLSAESNPFILLSQQPAHSLHWGDPHGGQVADSRKIRDFFRYARDAAAISFVGYQRNDHVHSNQDYAAQQAAEREFHAPEVRRGGVGSARSFIPLPGFEWSGEPDHGGHHNVYFRRFDQPMRRNSHWGLDDHSDADQDLPHVRDLHAAYRGTDTLITPHVGGGHADLTFHEPALEPALEITSTHGSFEWFLRESLERGYRMGFLGGSDSHDGRPGADSPGHQERRYAKGGLTALYVSELTLPGVHEALSSRRCYATTGARIVVSVRSGDYLMGESFHSSAPPTISVAVDGTAPLESVELYRGLDLIYTHPLPGASQPNTLRLLWHGLSRKMSYAGVRWDGSLTLAGAAIARVEQIRFDSPRSHVSDVTTSSLRWHSVQCGYTSGLVVHLADSSPDARLNLAIDTTVLSRPLFGGHGDDDPARMAYSPAERTAFSRHLSDLDAGPVQIPLGLVERSLALSRAPSPDNPRAVSFTFADPAPQPGLNAYWLRVTQSDMERAWTSPLFVDFVV
ncbi:MAG TPA: hypothetical protein VFX49_02570 [Chloroflexota bacterium]|nr:hypothetical protein [Chloroflexota bacterium]